MKLEEIHGNVLEEGKFVDALYRIFGFGKEKAGLIARGVSPTRLLDVAIKDVVNVAEAPAGIDFEEELRKAEELSKTDFEAGIRELKRLADISTLTGQRSKSLESLAKASEGKASHVWMFGDIDNMKFLNSTIGHRGTNAIIYRIGKLLEKHFGDIQNIKIFHAHGDEFAASAPIEGTSIDEFKKAAESTLEELASTAFVSQDDKKVRATMSMGIGLDYTQANKASRDAKKKGRFRVETY